MMAKATKNIMKSEFLELTQMAMGNILKRAQEDGKEFIAIAINPHHVQDFNMWERDFDPVTRKDLRCQGHFGDVWGIPVYGDSSLDRSQVALYLGENPDGDQAIHALEQAWEIKDSS